MNPANKISILMPVKDAANWLDDCIQSIKSQSYFNWELIAVDDHSTDNSFDLLAGFSKKDERINVYRNNGKGIVRALSLAFEKSVGSFIHRMDADDLMPKQKLEILYNLLGKNRDALATGNVQYFSSERVSQGYLDYEKWLNEIRNVSSEVYRECPVASPNWLVHRSCFEDDILFEELEYPEDYDLALKWHSKGYEFLKTSEVTHLWREHPKRTSRNSEIYQQESFFRLKLNHFVKNELQKEETLQLIGAGQKGKLVARILNEMSVPFIWLAFKQSKIDSNKILKSLDELDPLYKCLLANWPKDKNKQLEISQFLSSLELENGKNYWVV